MPDNKIPALMKPASSPVLEIGEWRTAGDHVWWSGAAGPVTIAMTTRVCGASGAPYDGLNLGLHVGDATAAVIENRASIWEALAPLGSASPVIAEQVHGVE